MAPKVKKTQQKKDASDEKLQAVVLTDSFETRFMPLSATTPRCLLPLVNVPLIEYTLEFLANAELSDVILVCSSHHEKIQHYIEHSKWSRPNSPIQITLVMSLESRSVGDAMRDIDNRGLITGDFLLVSGDVVTNIDFKKALSFHKQKSQQDKNHMVTMILNKASPVHRTRSKIDPGTFVLDKATNRCVFYQEIPNGKSSLDIDPELLEGDDFAIRNDLIDCHLDICTPHVPQIFQENFDYQYLRSDFLKGVLTSDLLRKTIYAYLSEESSDYSARVESWETYKAVSQDVLGRWTYPILPDCNLADDTTYSYEFNNVYKEEKVILAQSCKIGSSTAIGRNSKIGEGTFVAQSVIGRDCQIGNNVTIRNSYVLDGVTVEDDCILEGCVVASGAVLQKEAHLPPSTVINYNAKVGSGLYFSGNRQNENKSRNINGNNINNDDDDDDEEEEEEEGDDDDVAVDDEEDEDYEDYDNTDSSLEKPSFYLLSNISDDSIASVSDKKKRRPSRRRYSANSMMSEYDDEQFDVEGLATVSRAIENNHDIDTALLELNTLRMSMNVTYHDVRSVTSEAILKKVNEFVTTDTLKPQEATVKLFTHWGKMFKRQVFSPEEEVDLLQILESDISQMDSSFNQVVLFCVLKTLYDIDVVEEENILQWWNKGEESSVRTLAVKFINWLEEAEEE